MDSWDLYKKHNILQFFIKNMIFVVVYKEWNVLYGDIWYHKLQSFTKYVEIY